MLKATLCRSIKKPNIWVFMYYIGHNFSCSFEKTKVKFFISSNCIFGRLGNLQNTPVTLKLIHSIALPMLTFSLESMPLTKNQINSFGHPWTRIFMKVLSTFNSTIVQQCQHFFVFLPVEHYYPLKRMQFLTAIASSNNNLLPLIYEKTSNIDYSALANR